MRYGKINENVDPLLTERDCGTCAYINLNPGWYMQLYAVGSYLGLYLGIDCHLGCVQEHSIE